MASSGDSEWDYSLFHTLILGQIDSSHGKKTTINGMLFQSIHWLLKIFVLVSPCTRLLPPNWNCYCVINRSLHLSICHLLQNCGEHGKVHVFHNCEITITVSLWVRSLVRSNIMEYHVWTSTQKKEISWINSCTTWTKRWVNMLN